MVESLQPGMRLLSLLHEESGKSTDPLQVAMPPVELAQLLTEARPSAALAATPALRLGIDQVRPEALLTPPAHTAVAGTAPPVRKPAAEVEAVDWLFAQENGLFLSPLEAALLDQR